MKSTADAAAITPSEMRLALNEIYPDSTYGAVPVMDQFAALDAYRSIDDDALSEVAGAYEAYLDCQRSEWG